MEADAVATKAEPEAKEEVKTEAAKTETETTTTTTTEEAKPEEKKEEEQPAETSASKSGDAPSEQSGSLKEFGSQSTLPAQEEAPIPETAVLVETSKEVESVTDQSKLTETAPQEETVTTEIKPITKENVDTHPSVSPEMVQSADVPIVEETSKEEVAPDVETFVSKGDPAKDIKTTEETLDTVPAELAQSEKTVSPVDETLSKEVSIQSTVVSDDLQSSAAVPVVDTEIPTDTSTTKDSNVEVEPLVCDSAPLTQAPASESLSSADDSIPPSVSDVSVAGNGPDKVAESIPEQPVAEPSTISEETSKESVVEPPAPPTDDISSTEASMEPSQIPQDTETEVPVEKIPPADAAPVAEETLKESVVEPPTLLTEDNLSTEASIEPLQIQQDTIITETEVPVEQIPSTDAAPVTEETPKESVVEPPVSSTEDKLITETSMEPLQIQQDTIITETEVPVEQIPLADAAPVTETIMETVPVTEVATKDQHDEHVTAAESALLTAAEIPPLANEAADTPESIVLIKDINVEQVSTEEINSNANTRVPTEEALEPEMTASTHEKLITESESLVTDIEPAKNTLLEEQTSPLEEQTTSLEERTAPVEEQIIPVEEENVLLEEKTTPLEEQSTGLGEQTTPLERTADEPGSLVEHVDLKEDVSTDEVQPNETIVPVQTSVVEETISPLDVKSNCPVEKPTTIAEAECCTNASLPESVNGIGESPASKTQKEEAPAAAEETPAAEEKKEETTEEVKEEKAESKEAEKESEAKTEETKEETPAAETPVVEEKKEESEETPKTESEPAKED